MLFRQLHPFYKGAAKQNDLLCNIQHGNDESINKLTLKNKGRCAFTT